MSVSRPGAEARSVFRNGPLFGNGRYAGIVEYRVDYADDFAVGPEEEFAVTGTQDSLGAAGRGMRLGAVRVGVEQHEVGSCFGFPLEALHVHGVQPVAVAA